MKKFVALILMGVLLATMTACSSTFTCFFCGEEKAGKKHTGKEAGVEVTLCDDCYKGFSELFGN